MDCLDINKSVQVHGNGHDYTVHSMEWVGVCMPGAMCTVLSMTSAYFLLNMGVADKTKWQK